jgi:branched-chain amino acid transport system substrate-binding protein
LNKNTSASVSRRDFLKLAGVAGGTLALGGGAAGLLASCGGDGQTTSTAGAETTVGVSTTATPGSTATTGTTASAGAEQGREIKIGFVAPLTGALATFGIADKYCAERWDEVVANGWTCGDNKVHPIEFLVKDSQSDSNRAAQVAGDLIMNEKIDIMMVASTPDTVNPVADQCETLGIPCYSNDAPWQAYFFGRGATLDTPFKWTYHHFWGVEDIINVYTNVWKRIETNKVVGAMWPNDPDGNAFSSATDGFPSVLPGLGYTVVDPGRYQNGTEDYSSLISQFKKAGVEILTGVPIPPDFTNFWKQCLQQGFRPKIATIAKAVDLPAGVEALGEAGNNFTVECQWTPRFKFASSLTGETCQQIADEFEKRTNMQWAGYLLHYAVFEVVADALKRCTNVDDKETIVDAISKTKLDTLAGPVDFTTEPKLGTPHPVKNVCRSPLVAGQWVAGTKYKYDMVVVDNSNDPSIPVDAEPKLMV